MKKDFYIFRNLTVEPLFNQIEGCGFSGYDELDFPEGYKYYVWFYVLPFGKERNKQAEEIDFMKKRLRHLISNLPSESKLLCFTMTNTDSSIYDVRDSVSKSLRQYNDYIYNQAGKISSVQAIDFNSFTSLYGLSELFDRRYWYMAQMPINPKLAGDFQNWFRQKINAVEGIRKKCLIVDLDNTLWGGVLGEEGLAGIQLGNTYPGNCYSHLQTLIKELKNSGTLLSICSKNNQEIVEQVFSQREDMVLQLDDFVSLKINWKSKVENIKEIARELNVGLDSMVFVDDDPFEREQIKAFIPEVIVPEFPEHPYQLFDFMSDLRNQWFQIYDLTDEDKRKTEQYRENSERQNFRVKHDSQESFLKAMQIQLTFTVSSDLHLPRIAQITQKTNQFNLTTKRYTETELAYLAKQNYMFADIAVSDKFGDSGITASAIVKIDNHKAEIDSFLLSCRILGRGIETAFLYLVLNRLLEKNVTDVFALYIPTEKNIQVEQFYDDHGFQLISTNAEGQKKYHLELRKRYKFNKLYNVIIK